MPRGTTGPVKKIFVRKRIESIKGFYDSNVSSLMKSRGISQEEAADLSLTTLRSALDAKEAGLAAQIRKSEFAKVQQASFTADTKLQLAQEEAARAEYIEALDNFTEISRGSNPGTALLANAAAEAQFAQSYENMAAGRFHQSRGTLNRTVGIFPKENRQASLVIKTFASSNTPEANTVTINEFFLTQVSEPSNEKYQIYQTFDQDFIFFFDRNPHVYVYSGVLINAEDNFEWRNTFQREYENTLRGTKCVENGARAVLSFENVIRQGYLLDLNLQNTSNNPLHTPFSFTFFVTKESSTDKNTFNNKKYDELIAGESGVRS